MTTYKKGFCWRCESPCHPEEYVHIDCQKIFND